MGGLVFLTAVVITSLLYIRDYPRIIPVLFMTDGFGVIGFLDDYIKIVMKRSEGLNPVQKLIGQFIITGIFVYYLVCSDEVGTSMLVPFTGGFEHGIYLDLGFLFIPFVFFVVLGTDNGVNFTDGLDGLCTSVTRGDYLHGWTGRPVHQRDPWRFSPRVFLLREFHVTVHALRKQFHTKFKLKI